VYTDAYGLDIVCTRSFNHVGPDQTDRFVVSSFCRQAVEVLLGQRDHVVAGNLDIIRDFVDVRDVVRAYWLILEKGLRGQLYNVCSGQGTQLRTLLTIVEELVCKPLKVVIDEKRIRPTDNPVIVGDDSRLTDLGFRAQIPLRTSLGDQIETWKQRFADRINPS
jgi:GDP-4-dehydro-6-deoxy-D-mannose reductase